MGGMFARKVANAKPGDAGGLYFEAGLYPLVQITKLKLIISEKPGSEGVEKFVIVADILDSKVPARPAGMTGVSQTLNSMHAGAANDCKRFLMAIFPDVDPAEWDKEETLDPNAEASVVNTAQPAAGRLASLECYVKKNEKKGTVFTVHKWTAVPPEVQAQAAALRAKAGLPPL